MKRITVSFLSSLIFLTWGVLGASAQDYTPNYQLINKAAYPTNDLAVATYNALDYGIDNTGVTDCTTKLQTLLDKLAGVGTKSNDRGNYANITGGILYLPEGTYKVSNTIFIPRGVTLRGDWKKPENGQPVKGTVIAIYPKKYAQGKTTVSYSAFVMQPTSEISNLSFWYPEQDINNVMALPPTVLYGQSGYWGNDYCNVRHVTFVNSYIGIQFNDGNGGGCPNIFDVYGTPLYQGIVMDAIADVGRFDWIHFAPDYWAKSGLANAPSYNAVKNWTYNNATGFVMRRNDWSYTCNYTCDYYKVGFLAEASPRDGNKPNGHCYGFEMNNCEKGVHLTGISYCGYMFTRVNTNNCSYGVYLDAGCDGPAQFYNCNIGGTYRSIVMDNSASSPLMLEACTTNDMTLALGGELIANNSKFGGDVVINPTARTIFTGNTFTKGKLTNNSLYKCEVSNDKLATRTLPEYKTEWMEIKETRPAKAALYVVTDAKYGASPVDITVSLSGVADQSAAIQKALNEAGAAGGGIVYLPAGHYRMNSPLTIPTGVELKGASDLATVPKGNGAILEVMTGEGSETGTPFITMAKGSGLRGVTVNYPNQDNTTNVKKYPYTVRGNADVYIVNLALRAAYRGVDLFTNKCDNHYVDYLSGHAFVNVIRIGGNSENGLVSNIQCNTIAYASGDESKFGTWPNSVTARNALGGANIKFYSQNMEDLDFMIVGDCKNEILYNNFLYGCNKGLHFVDDGNGGAQNVRSLGNAVDGAVNTIVVEKIGTDLDLINSQVVALNHTDNIIKKSENATFITMGPAVNKTVTLFASDHWGGGSYFGKIDGGTLNLYLANFDQSGTVNTFHVGSGATVNMTTSRMKSLTKFSQTTGTDETRIDLVSSILDLTGATTSKFKTWNHNLSKTWTLTNTSAFLSRTGWTATASNNNGSARQAIDGAASTRWDTSGSQSNGQWFRVDMASAKTFNTVILDASNSPNDGPAGYKVEVSSNGTSWTTVAEGTAGGSMTFVTFDNVTARYVRVTQTGTKSNYWSIHEFYVGNLSVATGITQTEVDGQQATNADVYTLSGTLVLSTTCEELNSRLNSLEKGTYVVLMKDANGNRIQASKISIR